MTTCGALFILLNAASVAAQDASAAPGPPPRRTYDLQRAAATIEVDGSLGDEGWKGATVIPLPYEYFPGDNIPAPVRTEFLVTFGEEHLYLAFRAFDPEPGRIRAHLADRDAITTFQQDDHVGFILDPFNDERRGFQFRVNPLGVQADAVFSELEGIEDFSWDAIWESAGRITSEGYEVEVAIPFNQLRFPRTASAQTWGFDAFRSWPRSVRHRIAAKFTDRNLACILCQADKLTGLAGMTPGRNLEFDPTVTGRRTDRRDGSPAGPLQSGDAKADVGLTARWGITPNLILNATVNPDFSQVEADVAQLDVNTRFALFFPEKRPFFLEGIDFFATPLNTVFTRTIVDPVGGLKLTGKSGANAYGVFIARDEVNNILLPSNQGSDFASLDRGVTSAVARYRRDVGRTSTLGALYAGREGRGYHNRVFGLDAFVRPARSVPAELGASLSAATPSTPTTSTTAATGSGSPAIRTSRATSARTAASSRAWTSGRRTRTSAGRSSAARAAPSRRSSSVCRASASPTTTGCSPTRTRTCSQTIRDRNSRWPTSSSTAPRSASRERSSSTRASTASSSCGPAVTCA